MSVYDLAKKSGYCLSTVRRAEGSIRSDYGVGMQTIIDIAEALGMTVPELATIKPPSALEARQQVTDLLLNYRR